MAAAPAPSTGYAGSGGTGDAVLPAWRSQPIVASAIAGVVGGIVMGIMMMVMMPPMIGMIGSLIGQPSLGWPLHLVFSAIIGAGFGVALLVLGQRAPGWGAALGLGLAYGLLWWILGPLLLMPTMMGMGPQIGMAFSGDMLLSLVGHLVYGLITGAAFKAIADRF